MRIELSEVTIRSEVEIWNMVVFFLILNIVDAIVLRKVTLYDVINYNTLIG